MNEPFQTRCRQLERRRGRLTAVWSSPHDTTAPFSPFASWKTESLCPSSVVTTFPPKSDIRTTLSRQLVDPQKPEADPSLQPLANRSASGSITRLRTGSGYPLKRATASPLSFHSMTSWSADRQPAARCYLGHRAFEPYRPTRPSQIPSCVLALVDAHHAPHRLGMLVQLELRLPLPPFLHPHPCRFVPAPTEELFALR